MITLDNYRKNETGAKAKRLFQMAEQGLNVPEMFCVKSAEEAEKAVFDRDGLYSVRSSASCEDGAEMSFAGQFSTYLNVKGSEVTDHVRKCLESSDVKAYLEGMGAKAQSVGLTVIVQKMIDADVSGVMFTADPRGILNEAVIAVGRGTGNNVVEDKTDVTQYYYNLSDDVYCYEVQGESPVLDDGTVRELIENARRITAIFGEYQDIEFAIKDGVIYILQCRPITSIDASHPVVLDSSNISESYPGISLPLTVSFVREVYYLVFRSSVRRTTRNDGTAERIDETLHNMTDSVNGRIYYRISNWYDVICLLPFSKKIIPVWQEMLGVGDKKVSHESGKVSLSTKLRVALSFVQLLFTNCKRMEKLEGYFEGVYQEYSKKIADVKDAAKLPEIYEALRDALAGEWDITLANDMYTFIFTGLLKKRLTKRFGDEGGKLTNLCIAGNSTIKSMEPVRKLFAIKQYFENTGKLDELAEVESAEQFYKLREECPEGGRLIDEYIELYGDRCPEELKLETETFRVAPWRLCKNIAAAADVKNEAERELPKLGVLERAFAKRAARGIRLRESSRLARGRIFGLMRKMVLKSADELVAGGRLAERSDVFYLTMEELFAAVRKEGGVPCNVVAERRERWAGYKELPLYSRLVFADKPFDKRLTGVKRGTANDGILRGIPCSEGIAEGQVVLVEKPSPDIDTKGKIIAARMTDPGWVFMITGAAGIISERGSLLSHTAIISRELHKPSVVGVKELFDRVHDGDTVRINGATGEITILFRKKD